MLAIRFCFFLLPAVFIGGCQTSQTATTDYGYNQSVASGRATLMGDYNSVGGSGTSCVAAPARVVVLEQGAHGTISIGQGRSRARTSGSPIAHCDGRMFPTTTISYRSQPGYRGLDVVKYAVQYRDGATETYRKIINVR